MAWMRVGDDRFELNFADITNREAMLVEKACGCTFDQFVARLTEGSMEAVTAFVWTLRKRADAGVRFDDVVFQLGDIEFGSDDGDEPADNGASAEVVTGGQTAEFNPVDPTAAPEASTTGAPTTSEPSPRS
jgi:hypothetical protein